jgi:hypothetical protein
MDLTFIISPYSSKLTKTHYQFPMNDLIFNHILTVTKFFRRNIGECNPMYGLIFDLVITPL